MKYSNLADFLAYVKARDPQQPEFHQAVEEVMDSLWSFIATHPQYAEAGLLERCAAFQRDGQAQSEFLRGLGVVPTPGARLISLFAYENTGLASWLDALAQDPAPTHLLVPEGRVLGDVQRWLGVEALAVGAVYVLAMLALFQQGGNRFSFLSFGASKAKDAEGKAAAVS